MARTATLSQLINEVRQRADIENDPHITDAEVTRFINQSAAHLHAMMTDAAPENFYLSSSFTTVANQKTYSIPASTLLPSASFYKLAHIEAQIQGYWRSLEQWTFEKQTMYRNANTWGLQAQPVSYRLEYDDKISFAPIPDGGYNIQVYWVPAFLDMSGASATFDGKDGWEEWVVLDAAIKCATKDQTDTSVLINERERVEMRIRSQYTTRDLDHPDRVRDTANSYEGVWPWSVR